MAPCNGIEFPKFPLKNGVGLNGRLAKMPPNRTWWWARAAGGGGRRGGAEQHRSLWWVINKSRNYKGKGLRLRPWPLPDASRQGRQPPAALPPWHQHEPNNNKKQEGKEKMESEPVRRHTPLVYARRLRSGVRCACPARVPPSPTPPRTSGPRARRGTRATRQDHAGAHESRAIAASCTAFFSLRSFFFFASVSAFLFSLTTSLPLPRSDAILSRLPAAKHLPATTPSIRALMAFVSARSLSPLDLGCFPASANGQRRQRVCHA